ncbi:MAG: hypothetical protein LBS97_05320 [Treponema sp.]|jgi:mannan endo-1,4-beta-mannosidase|nr:hypothetical protein [Treponema sp.]
MKRTKLFAFAAVVAALCLLVSCASKDAGGGGAAAAYEWNFDNAGAGTDRWELTPSEFYQYTGPINLSWDDQTFGNGALKIDLDFSDPANQNNWSEPKLKIDFLRAVNLRGLGAVSFDFYFDPSLRNMGQFQTQIYAEYTGGKVQAISPISSSGETLENGFVKVKAVIPFEPVKAFLTNIRLSLVGSDTDYVGPVYIDNIRFDPLAQ